MGHVLPSLQDAALEILPDEVERDDDVFDAERLAIPLRAGELFLVLPCAVGEGEGEADLLPVLVEQRGRIHAARIYYDCFHAGEFLQN